MVRVVVATQQGGLDDQVSQVFGRCQTYTIVDAENGEIQNAEVAQNQYANAMSGAGIQAAGFVANQGAEAVISGNFGPNVASVFNQSGVKMVPASGTSVREAVLSYLDGELEPVSQATSAAKRGMGGGGQGMGQGMKSQQPQQGSGQAQPGQQPIGGPQQQPSTSGSQGQPQTSEDDKIKQLEERMENLENQLNKIVDALEDLK